MEIDVSTLRRREAYALLTSVIVPRAIGFVSTKDGQGRTNVAPFSYFTGLGSDPPMLTLGIAHHRDGRPKDTLRAVKETGVFCVNLVEEPIAEQMNQASGEYPPDVSEFDVTGLTPVPCVAIECVRVGESRAALECRLVDVHEYGRTGRVSLVVGEVVHAYLHDDIVAEGATTADPRKMHPVARLGGPYYARLGEIFEMQRPKVDASEG